MTDAPSGPFAPPPTSPAAEGQPGRSWLVSVAAALLFVSTRSIPLPGVDHEVYAWWRQSTATALPVGVDSIGILSIRPIQSLLLARWVDRRGVAGGLAVLWIADLVLSLAPWMTTWPRVEEPLGAVAGALLCVGVWSAFLHRSLGREGEDPLPEGWVPVPPLSGIYPILIAAGAGALVGNGLSSGQTQVVEGVVLIATAAALGWAFNRPDLVARSRRPASPTSDPRAAFVRGMVLTALSLLAFHVLLEQAGTTNLGLGAFALIALASFAWDAGAELRFQHANPSAVAAEELHRTWACLPIKRLLAREGIPCHIRGRALRALFQALGPQFPMEVLVPAHQAAAARRLLAPALESGLQVSAHLTPPQTSDPAPADVEEPA